MSEGRRGLWATRGAILAWLGVVLVPLVLEVKELDESPAIAALSFDLLLAVPLFLGALVLVRERPGLSVVITAGTVLIVATVLAGWDALDDVSYAGWRPAVWAGLLVLSQAMIVFTAGRAWRGGPRATGPFSYVKAFAAGAAPFLVGAAMTPMGRGVHQPSLNETLVIADIRTMLSAQHTYQSMNGGFYDRPECLGNPRSCLPGYPANAPAFLGSELGSTTVDRRGYRRIFHPGPPADPAAVRESKASASSVVTYAYVAVPLRYGRTGMRGFCGDADGRICYTPDGTAPPLENGLCAPSCPDLR